MRNDQAPMLNPDGSEAEIPGFKSDSKMESAKVESAKSGNHSDFIGAEKLKQSFQTASQSVSNGVSQGAESLWKDAQAFSSALKTEHEPNPQDANIGGHYSGTLLFRDWAKIWHSVSSTEILFFFSFHKVLKFRWFQRHVVLKGRFITSHKKLDETPACEELCLMATSMVIPLNEDASKPFSFEVMARLVSQSVPFLALTSTPTAGCGRRRGCEPSRWQQALGSVG
jgi:hypothetical protein